LTNEPGGLSMPREFTCRECGLKVFDASSLSRSQCAGCTWLAGITIPEDRERVRKDLVAKGIIGDKLVGNSPPEDHGDLTGPKPGRMVKIADLIAELQKIEERFGNTCCYVSGLAWGSVALWRDSWADALKADPTPEIIEAAAEAIWDDDSWKRECAYTKDRTRQQATAAINAYRKAIGATT